MWAPALQKLEQYFFWTEKPDGPPPKYCQQSMDFFKVFQTAYFSLVFTTKSHPTKFRSFYVFSFYLHFNLMNLKTLLIHTIPQVLPVLDPTQACSLVLSLDMFRSMPLFSVDLVPEVQIKTYIAELKSGRIDRGDTCLTDYWSNRRHRAPELSTAAIASLSIPCHSAEVERSFSAYTKIMIPQRTNMRDSYLKLLNQMVYNNN